MSDNNISNVTPPAGWYPDPHSPGAQRYWDGTQWTAHTAVADTAAAAVVSSAPAAEPGIAREPAVALAPAGALAAPAKRGFPRLKWWQWALIAVGVLVLIGAISGALGGGRSDAGSSDDDPASVAGQQEEQPEPEPVMVVVPNVVGMDGVTARATLEALGFEVAYDGDDSMPVIAQEVVEGAEAEEGSTITFTLEEKPQLTLGQQNAIDSALSYLDFSAFSRQGLYDQLTSEYGEEFTPAQAEHALAAVGY